MSSYVDPKRRLAPTRSLRQPQSLSVKEASSTSSSSSSTKGGARTTTDSAALRQSFQDRAEANKATMVAMESLLEDVPVSRSAFKEACTYLLPSSYLSILHERHLSSLCSHPLCRNPPRKPFTSFSTPRSRIIRDASDGSKKIVQVTGNEEDGFCSKECWKRSEWVRRSGMLGEEGRWLRGKDGATVGGVGGNKWELLEEVEERLEKETELELEKEMETKAWEEAEKGREGEVASTEEVVKIYLVSSPLEGSGRLQDTVEAPLSTPTRSLPSITPPPISSSSPARLPAFPLTSTAPPPPAPPLSGPAALIASLTIKERSTPSLLPQPPSLQSQTQPQTPKPNASASSSTKPAPKIGSSPPPVSHKTAARLKEERRRADASAGAMIPGSVGRMGDVLVGANAGKGKGKFEKNVAVGGGKGKQKEGEVGERNGEVEGEAGAVNHEVEADKDEDEDVDGLKDVWEDMYKARGELEEKEGEGETT